MIIKLLNMLGLFTRKQVAKAEWNQWDKGFNDGYDAGLAAYPFYERTRRMCS